MKIRKVLLVLGMVMCGTFAMAQSQVDLELAKQIAKQQGYSDQQINDMMSKYGVSTEGGAISFSSPAVNRNTAVQELQQQKQQQQQAAEAEAAKEEEEAKAEQQSKADRIYGHNIFKNKDLNFVPSYNIPTPANYKLTPGDEVVIDIWGDVISNITATISPEGSVSIPNLGPVYIAGQTAAQAERSLKSYLGKIYSGISSEEPTTFVKLALGKTTTVTVNIVGDVQKPGGYTLPALSTIASAMYLAEGPNDLGTIRQINLYRNGKLVSSFDLYEFIVNGTFNSNVRLEDNDVISVAPYSGIVTVEGGVKRPMMYEIKPGETLDKVLAYAGGFQDMAFTDKVHIDRVATGGAAEAATGESFDVMAEQFGSFQLKDGDIITVNTNTLQYRNRVKIAGAVWRPGTYAITGNTSNIKQLIRAAGGLKDDAYTDKGFVVRLAKDRSKEQVSFSVQDVILGKENIMLSPDDSVVIFNKEHLKPFQTVKIFGEVNKPSATGMFEFREGMTIGDLILMAGGPSEAATLSKVEIARRIKNSSAVEDMAAPDTIATIMHYNLLKNPADADVKLHPYDIVFVRRSASYKPQQSVTIEGEVNYPGTYVVAKSTVRLSDVVGKADGFTKDAYVKGAKLTRQITKDEFDRIKVAKEIAKKQVNDTSAVDSLEIGRNYTIAIDLEKAVNNPGSVADVVLREGDVIVVPKFNNTVKISGSVLYPNTISFEPKKSWQFYLSNAGGATQDAVKRKTYMVHMNGSVAVKGDPGFKVQPGTEIIVPSKAQSGPKRDLSGIISIATSTASLAAMIVTIVNQM
ncbi:MAG: SLBB domain-containing protein [Bacteroidales bacterium]|nr:SLBB domain-containing protein [Bacteroidales bacterium]MBQ8644891.1 SLBB domain-containing protein [Bacteroidales bacterium]